MSGESKRRDDDELYDDPYGDFELDWDEDLGGENFDEVDPRLVLKDIKKSSEERLERKKKNTKKKKRRKERRDKHNMEWED